MFGSVKNYIQDQIALVKLEGIEAVGRVASKLIFILLIGIFIMFFILLASFAAGFYLGELYGRYVGFLIVAGIYLLLMILFFIFKAPIQNMLMNIAVASAMADNSDKKEEE
ncbi:MAG: phage holin family protein [Flavobacteriaceae bacterium]|nr:phage holin family protein [Flavobacteriaceae bacterium]